MTQRMWQSPDPAVAGGGGVTIYYMQFPGIIYPFTLTVLGEPCGSVQEFPINGPSDLRFHVNVPKGCEGGTIRDSSMQSVDYAIQIST